MKKIILFALLMIISFACSNVKSLKKPLKHATTIEQNDQVVIEFGDNYLSDSINGLSYIDMLINHSSEYIEEDIYSVNPEFDHLINLSKDSSQFARNDTVIIRTSWKFAINYSINQLIWNRSILRFRSLFNADVGAGIVNTDICNIYLIQSKNKLGRT